MWKSAGVASLVLVLAGPAAAEAERGKITLSNDASRPVYCAIVIDGRTRNYIHIRPGKTYVTELDTDRRAVQLVCERAKRNAYGPLRFDTAYSLVDGDRRFVDLVEGSVGAE